MTVQPLTKDDLLEGLVLCAPETPKDQVTYISLKRLRELFAELKRREEGIRHFEVGCITRWKHVEELFGPLVPK